MLKKPALLLIACLPLLCLAGRPTWRGFRYEFIFGAGAANFLGELGGAPQIGSHAFRDLDLSSTRPSAILGMRYRTGDYTALRASFSYGRLHGDDKKTQEYYRHYRNLNFSSHVYEFAVVFEAAFMKEEMGRRYRIRGYRGRRGYAIYNYGFAGLGAFRFNPTTTDNGTTVQLQPLHTEGQGIFPSRKPYNRVVVCIPVGIGFRFIIAKKWSLGLEYGLRYTFTDYLDDVSSTYVDPEILKAQFKNDPAKGNLSAKMSNRSNPTSAHPEGDPYGPGAVPGNAAPGGQRGDPRYNDAYMFALVTLNYKLKTLKGNLPKF